MNSAYLHLLLNHFPIIGLFVVLVALLYAIWKGNQQLLNFSLAGLVVLTLLSIPLGETGEAAEEVIENTPGFNESFVEEHEEAAEMATPLMFATGAAALLGLFFSRGKNNLPGWLKGVVTLLAIVTQLAMIRTGYLGGKIRRPELQNASAVQIPGVQQESEEEEY
jgi:hypothetical protein